MKRFSLLFVLAVIFAVACTKKGPEPRGVVMDRDVCASCGMQLNDPRFITQVVHKANGTHAVFEEVGCAVTWLEDRGKENGWGSHVFYVTDLKNGGWIKFEDAYFTVEYMTPMSYGVAALADAGDVEEGKTLISREQAVEHILTVYEERAKARGVH